MRAFDKPPAIYLAGRVRVVFTVLKFLFFLGLGVVAPSMDSDPTVLTEPEQGC